MTDPLIWLAKEYAKAHGYAHDAYGRIVNLQGDTVARGWQDFHKKFGALAMQWGEAQGMVKHGS